MKCLRLNKSYIELTKLTPNTPVFIVASFINALKFCLDFLAVGLAAWNEILKEHYVIDYFDVENEESPIISYADTVDVLVADKFLAIGDVR